MEELNHNFGQLSTSAAEWKPAAATAASNNSTSAVVVSSSSTTPPPPDSDLKASSVKEFVPGRGWVSEAQQQQQQEGEKNERISGSCFVFLLALFYFELLGLFKAEMFALHI